VRDYRSRSYIPPLSILSLFGSGLPARRNPLIGLVGDVRGWLLPLAISGGAWFYFQCNASTNSALNPEWSNRTDLLFIFVLLTYLFCDTACSNAIDIFTERLIAPFWRRARDRCLASVASSAGGSQSFMQWLCSPCHNEKDSRPCRSMRVSQNRAPPHIPSLSTYSYT
jgi:hypothetical protein